MRSLRAVNFASVDSADMSESENDFLHSGSEDDLDLGPDQSSVEEGVRKSLSSSAPTSSALSDDGILLSSSGSVRKQSFEKAVRDIRLQRSKSVYNTPDDKATDSTLRPRVSSSGEIKMPSVNAVSNSS